MSATGARRSFVGPTLRAGDSASKVGGRRAVFEGAERGERDAGQGTQGRQGTQGTLSPPRSAGLAPVPLSGGREGRRASVRERSAALGTGVLRAADSESLVCREELAGAEDRTMGRRRGKARGAQGDGVATREAGSCRRRAGG